MKGNYLIKVKSVNIVEGDKTEGEVITHADLSFTDDGYTIIQSTHDPEQAYLYSDKILAIHGGKVLSWGTPQEVMTESLVSTLYNVDVEVCSMHDDRIRVCVPADINK